MIMGHVVILEDNKITGFCSEDNAGVERCNEILASGGFKIDKELWQYLLALGDCKFTGTVEEREYTILDKDLFERIVQLIDDTPKQPTLEERLAALEALMMGVI